MNKTCSKCKLLHPLSEFCRNKNTKDGLSLWCKSCQRVSARCWIENNREKTREMSAKWKRNHPEHYKKYRIKNRNKILSYKEQYRKTNKSKLKEYAREYRTTNQKHLNELQRIWFKKNPGKRSEYGKKARSTPMGAINFRMRGRIWDSLRGNKNRISWQKLVGYTTDDLRKHLENKFTIGMTWELFLAGKIHIDHIIPLSFFRYDTTDDAEFKYCWSLNNLQPLWAKDNQRKSNHIRKDGSYDGWGG